MSHPSLLSPAAILYNLFREGQEPQTTFKQLVLAQASLLPTLVYILGWIYYLQLSQYYCFNIRKCYLAQAMQFLCIFQIKVFALRGKKKPNHKNPHNTQPSFTAPSSYLPAGIITVYGNFSLDLTELLVSSHVFRCSKYNNFA